jgi:hypothetical protein
MNTRLNNPRWRCLPPQILAQQQRLGAILLRWEGTPYRPGQQKEKAGVDCVRFVAAVLDELRGTSTPIETLPPDAAMHTREGAIASMLNIKRAFMPCELVGDNSLEPGDVLVTGPPGGGRLGGPPGPARGSGRKPERPLRLSLRRRA